MSSDLPMTPPTTILLATDLSARCDRALDRAIQLARQWNARLVAVSVVDAGTLSSEKIRASSTPSWGETAYDPVTQISQRLKRDAAVSDIDIITRVVEGKVAETLLKVAEEEGAGLIVTGIARSESLGRTVLGSSVDWLVRHSKIPVLVVRDRAHDAYSHIVVASDYSPSSRIALEASAHLFPQTQITLLNAFDVPFVGMMDTAQEAAIAKATQNSNANGQHFVESSNLSESQRALVKVLSEKGEPVRLTYEYARDHNADLIALCTHGRSALFDILIGSVAKRILETAATDVLLIREPHAKS